MPDHDKPIEDADVWDILDWKTVCDLAATAPDDPRDDHGDHVWATVAKLIVAEGSKTDSDGGEALVLKYASSCVGHGKPAQRRQRASEFARQFGARPGRLIEFLAYKKGLFGRVQRG